MITVYIVISLMLAGILVLVAGVVPVPSELSRYELDRAVQKQDPRALEIVRREQLLPDVISLQRIVTSLLLVIFVAVVIAVFGWLVGGLLAVGIALEYGALARLSPVATLSNSYYQKYEAAILRFVERFDFLFRFVRISLPTHVPFRLRSKDELIHLVEESTGVVSADEKKLIINGLGAAAQAVESVMTPRSVIESIDKKEHLGPLVLDDLHKTGHSRFPVIDKDIDHVIGMLHVRDLLEIDARRKSTSVEKAMEPRVYYIKHDQTLEHALAAFLRTRHHLFIVINEFRETVGILTLEDVMEALLGRKIIDEFDTHEDLRKVAERNPHRNNRSDTAVDV